jgi:hypothetical protein
MTKGCGIFMKVVPERHYFYINVSLILCSVSGCISLVLANTVPFAAAFAVVVLVALL